MCTAIYIKKNRLWRAQWQQECIMGWITTVAHSIALGHLAAHQGKAHQGNLAPYTV